MIKSKKRGAVVIAFSLILFVFLLLMITSEVTEMRVWIFLSEADVNRGVSFVDGGYKQAAHTGDFVDCNVSGYLKGVGVISPQSSESGGGWLGGHWTYFKRLIFTLCSYPGNSSVSHNFSLNTTYLNKEGNLYVNVAKNTSLDSIGLGASKEFLCSNSSPVMIGAAAFNEQYIYSSNEGENATGILPKCATADSYCNYRFNTLDCAWSESSEDDTMMICPENYFVNGIRTFVDDCNGTSDGKGTCVQIRCCELATTNHTLEDGTSLQSDGIDNDCDGKIDEVFFRGDQFQVMNYTCYNITNCSLTNVAPNNPVFYNREGSYFFTAIANDSRFGLSGREDPIFLFKIDWDENQRDCENRYGADYWNNAGNSISFGNYGGYYTTGNCCEEGVGEYLHIDDITGEKGCCPENITAGMIFANGSCIKRMDECELGDYIDKCLNLGSYERKECFFNASIGTWVYGLLSISYCENGTTCKTNEYGQDGCNMENSCYDYKTQERCNRFDPNVCESSISAYLLPTSEYSIMPPGGLCNQDENHLSTRYKVNVTMPGEYLCMYHIINCSCEWTTGCGPNFATNMQCSGPLGNINITENCILSAIKEDQCNTLGIMRYIITANWTLHNASSLNQSQKDALRAASGCFGDTKTFPCMNTSELSFFTIWNIIIALIVIIVIYVIVDNIKKNKRKSKKTSKKRIKRK